MGIPKPNAVQRHWGDGHADGKIYRSVEESDPGGAKPYAEEGASGDTRSSWRRVERTATQAKREPPWNRRSMRRHWSRKMPICATVCCAHWRKRKTRDAAPTARSTTCGDTEFQTLRESCW